MTHPLPPVTSASAPAWARNLSADEEDDGEEDDATLEDTERTTRQGRRNRTRQARP